MKHILSYSKFQLNEAGMFKDRRSSEELQTLVDLGLMDISALIDTWKWDPELIIKYIYSLPNPEGVKISGTNSEITLTYRRDDTRFAVYHLVDDAGYVAGWVENSTYGEDDDMDPYGGNSEGTIDSNSLSNKIAKFMDYPGEYTGAFQ